MICGGLPENPYDWRCLCMEPYAWQFQGNVTSRYPKQIPLLTAEPVCSLAVGLTY